MRRFKVGQNFIKQYEAFGNPDRLAKRKFVFKAGAGQAEIPGKVFQFENNDFGLGL